MMSYERWLQCILEAVGHIADREYQRQSWFSSANEVSSPEELYLTLMEDCTADLFFEKYDMKFDDDQKQVWNSFRSRLEKYYDSLPENPDRKSILDDPEWNLVRQSADEFVRSFSGANSR